MLEDINHIHLLVQARIVHYSMVEKAMWGLLFHLTQSHFGHLNRIIIRLLIYIIGNMCDGSTLYGH